MTSDLPPVFADKSHSPDDADLIRVLGRAKSHWDRLVAQAREADARVLAEWKHYSSTSGWTLVLRDKRRNVLYLKPAKKQFLASFAIGEAALEAARQAGVPKAIVGLIEDAPKYPEGRAVRVDVKSAATFQVASTLLAVKMARS